MIYSKKLHKYIPTIITTESAKVKDLGTFTRYWLKDNMIPVGYVDLQDTPKGVFVKFIRNIYPDLYSNLGNMADQIEVEHCLKRGLDTFEIISEAGLNSHAVHYKRGKKFENPENNKIVEEIIKTTPKNQIYNTRFLGAIKMFMPQEMIEKIREVIKTNPLILDK